MTRMAKYLSIFMGFAIFLTSAEAAQANDIPQDIDRILWAFHPRAKIGIVVQSMQTGQILYQRNQDELLVPASNLKLFTAYAALDKLGPQFKFQTQLLTDATSFNNGMLEGNLYAKFNGDPELELEDLENLVIDLKNRGVREIKG